MLQNINPKRFDLEDRTLKFAADVRVFVKKLPKNITNLRDIPQLIDSSGSVGANYIEANEALSKKDFFMRIKISRKEAKESKYWLILIDTYQNVDLEKDRNKLIQEALELTKIFGSILEKNVTKEF
ncbi:four helix bundle protein [Candidatus Roizmanbacteria bacterium RIFCSPHIGHO2_01_FULL_35_10]|uniref:Four helix bundle protein n=1 Tax=Candidatus Roizmanbacteria bacterium RIFCSPLOWO2_01_FULL_35_13 TaxID=1802055 RepID=A0A1F7I6T0_9BACT|nr:MAG: four helix bundle protein [Candidatus Roizmanbacteria bacterium RIFCSPHIGHO2_01_FULL_35_10]OGK39074.1 MAG: four helix bundle protein [Candidatus Roizmanbacteria bacterium RIFCSPLOWO2_01_FULL_35_13]